MGHGTLAYRSCLRDKRRERRSGFSGRSHGHENRKEKGDKLAPYFRDGEGGCQQTRELNGLETKEALRKRKRGVL